MVNKKTVKEFQAELNKLAKDIKMKSFIKVMEDKILDYIQKHRDVDLFELRALIKESFGQQFEKYVISVFKKYNSTLEVVNEIYADLGIDVQRNLTQIQRIEAVNQIKLGRYKDEAIKEIQRRTRKALIKKFTFKEFSEDLAAVDEKVSHYSDTIATTQLRAYAQTAKNFKANIAEVFYYEYVGVIRKNTRAFCKGMLGQTFHINQINKFNESVVGPAFINPCIIYKGGWNCLHDWEPDPFYKD